VGKTGKKNTMTIPTDKQLEKYRTRFESIRIDWDEVKGTWAKRFLIWKHFKDFGPGTAVMMSGMNKEQQNEMRSILPELFDLVIDAFSGVTREDLDNFYDNMPWED